MKRREIYIRELTKCSKPVRGRAFINENTGEVRPIPCGAWSCPSCGLAKAHRLGLLASASAPERFVTLSRAGDDASQALKRLRTLSKALRRSGMVWEYLAVPERHQNGSWHLHLLQRGDFIPQRLLSRRAAAAGMGSVVWIERVQGSQRVARYLVKYLAKSLGDDRPKGSRRYATSQGFFPGGRAALEARVLGSDSGESWATIKGDW